MRFVAICAVILSLAYAAPAQNFDPKISLISAGSQRDLVLTEDFDDDGDQDLLLFQPSVSSEDCCLGNYYLQVNDGTGNFSEEIEVATNLTEWENSRGADIDNDGLTDIVVYQSSDNTISLYHNMGAKGFSPATTLLTDYSGGSFEVADLTSDGLADIIYSLSNEQSELFLMTNLGELNFAESVQVAAGELIRVVDFDRDGQNDLFTLEEGSQIVWQQNTGDGTFSANPTSITNEIPFFTPELVIGDFDGNTTNELVISYAIAGEDDIITPKLYSYNESGEFVLQGSLVELKEFDLSPVNTMVSDIDQDGDLDILASFAFALAFARTNSVFDQYVGWYENTGNFQFTPRLTDDALTTGFYVDLNNDQQLDILFDTSYELLWQENLGQATFSAPNYLTDNRALVTASPDEGGTTVNFGDLNQDNLPEVIVSEGSSNKVLYFANQNGELAVPPQLLTLNTLIPGGAAVLETTNNTNLLLIGGDAIEGQHIFRYTVQEDFALAEKDTLYSGLLDPILYTGDFNGDGLPDVAFTDRSLSVDGEVYVLLNETDGTFRLVDTQIIGAIEDAYDLNQDSKTDLVIGTGIFTSSQEDSFELLADPEFPFNHIEDINGDNRSDFLLFTEVEVTLYLANNDGTYQEQTLTFEGDYDFTTTPWLLMDVDGDQDKDLVFVHDTGSQREVAFLENTNSTTSFGNYTTIGATADFSVLLFGHDIDQDTDTDLVVLSNTELAWYRNTAAGAAPSNSAPTVANPIEDQRASVGEEFTLVLDDVFQDTDAGDSLALSATLTDDTPLPDWLTYDAENNTLNGTPPNAAEITIKVTATDTSSASVNDEFILTVEEGKTITGLDDPASTGVRLYPVPASQTVFLEIQPEEGSLTSYRLLDTQGREYQYRVAGSQDLRIDVSTLPQGIYLLEIHTTKRRLQRRIVIE